QRIHYTVGDDIAVFIYFTHAKSDNDTDTSITLGTAYYNTSVVIYEQTLRDLNESQGYDLLILEETTVQHEFSHILGLVNLRDDDIHANHEDPLHGKHCIVEDCLMYYASNRSQFFRNRSTVPELDPLCIEDLQAKGGK
ncbi:MAG: membrane metalloprotease, partial [Bacteroidetes bacterium]|nr:membrane metalloprotease [Bacteroidota bacterium]